MKEITERLAEQRRVENAKKIVESAGYQVIKEAGVTLSPEEMNNPNGINLRDIGKRAYDKQKAAEEADAASKRDAEIKAKYADVLEKIENSTDPNGRIQTAFDELVPPSGHAETKAGELVRAMMRILYRSYNDGDVFYEGYGKTTCGDAAVFLMDKITDLTHQFEDIADAALTGNKYEGTIEDIAEQVIDYILKTPSTLTANTEDYQDWDASEIDDWEPRYDIDISYPESIPMHIERGDISEKEFLWEIASWEAGDGNGSLQAQGAEISLNDDVGTVFIQGILKDTYEELDKHGYQWMESYAEDLNSEYGDPTDEEDEDEE